MSRIDSKLNEVYNFVENYINKEGFPPSIRDICSQLNIKSTATAYSYIEKLKDKGLIETSPSKKRAIMLTNRQNDTVYAPVIGVVAAGTPIFAVENFENFCPLPPEFANESEVFMLKVKGESMIEAGIYNGDKIIVRKQNTADEGEIVVALIDDEATVKRFYRKNGKIILHPENETMNDIIVDEVQILGKVLGLYRKF